MKQIEKYFSKHVFANSLVHLLLGMGVGILLTRQIFDPYPVKWAMFFIGIGVLANFFAYNTKK